MATPRARAAPKADKAQLDELAFLKEQERLLTAAEGLKDFWFFTTTCLWPEESKVHFYEPLHKPICDKVSGFKPGARDLLIMMRKGRKTNLRTIALCCWLMAKDINIRIMVLSSLDRTAKDFLAAVKRQLQQNKVLTYYYPHLKVPSAKLGNELAFTHPSRTNFGLVDPTLYATYLGAPLIGRRFDVCIADDPQDDEDVSTPEQASKSLRFFNTIFPLADENPRWNWIVVNGTRKGFNDIYAHLMGEATGNDVEVESPPFTFTVIPALAGDDGKADIDGKPTFPTVLPTPTLMGYLAQAQLNPQEGVGYFYREYLCVCQAPNEQQVLEEWLLSWVPVLPPVVWSGILIDTATKDKQTTNRGDYCVALVVHYDHYGHLYVSDGIRSNSYRFADFARELIALSDRAGGVFTLVKEKCGTDVWFPAIEEAYHRMRKPCVTMAVNVAQEGRKVTRIVNALQGPLQARRVHFVGNQRDMGFPLALWKVLRDELTHINGWAHDDAADALSLAFHKDIRIVPSAGRSVPWQPMYRARLPQASLQFTNPAAAAARSRAEQWQQGDGSLRGVDPFVEQLTGHLGGEGQLKRGPMPSLPMPIKDGGNEW